ncbi:MAG: hypothetical protein ABIJ61_02465, partial [bacterium]
RAANRSGSYGAWGLIFFLALVYVLNLFGPPPTAVGPIAVIGLFQWLLVAWGYWVDHNRTVVLISERQAA